MKNCLLREELQELGKALNTSWISKKKNATATSPTNLSTIYTETAMANGALGGKISGAGGGGFMFFYCPGNSCYKVSEALDKMHIGHIQQFEFCKKGLITWTVKE